MGRRLRTRLGRARVLLAVPESSARLILRRAVDSSHGRGPGPRLSTVCAGVVAGALIAVVATHGGGPEVRPGLDAGVPYTTPSPVPGLMAPAPPETRPGAGSLPPAPAPPPSGDRATPPAAAPPAFSAGAGGRAGLPAATRPPRLLAVRPPALLASVPPVLGSVTRLAGSATHPVTGLLSAAGHPLPSAVRSLLPVRAASGHLPAGGAWAAVPPAPLCCGAWGGLPAALSAARTAMVLAEAWPRLGAGGWGDGAGPARIAPLRPRWAAVTGGWLQG